jgi:hypothetical protein
MMCYVRQVGKVVLVSFSREGYLILVSCMYVCMYV